MAGSEQGRDGQICTLERFFWQGLGSGEEEPGQVCTREREGVERDVGGKEAGT